MSVYKEFICETCRERHPIPRLWSPAPNRYAAQDKYFNDLKEKHEALGHVTNSYNDVAPSGREGNDLIFGGYMCDEELWVKDYYLFSVIHNSLDNSPDTGQTQDHAAQERKIEENHQ